MAKIKVERVVEADSQKVCDLARLVHEESMFKDIAFRKPSFSKPLITP